MAATGSKVASEGTPEIPKVALNCSSLKPDKFKSIVSGVDAWIVAVSPVASVCMLALEII